jgi:hypothetical protein
MIYPLLIHDYYQAVKIALDESITNNMVTYLIRCNSGGYIIDVVGEIFSDEKLVMAIFKGEVR